MKKEININIDAKWLAETDKLIKISKRDLDEITNITADQERVVGINISARRYSKVLGDILSETIKKYEDFAKEIKEIISSESQNIQAGETENLPQTPSSIAIELAQQDDIHANKATDKKSKKVGMGPFDLPETDNATDNSLEQPLVVTLDYIETCEATVERATENPKLHDLVKKIGPDNHSQAIAEMDPVLHDNDVASP